MQICNIILLHYDLCRLSRYSMCHLQILVLLSRFGTYCTPCVRSIQANMQLKLPKKNSHTYSITCLFYLIIITDKNVWLNIKLKDLSDD